MEEEDTTNVTPRVALCFPNHYLVWLHYGEPVVISLGFHALNKRKVSQTQLERSFRFFTHLPQPLLQGLFHGLAMWTNKETNNHSWPTVLFSFPILPYAQHHTQASGGIEWSYHHVPHFKEVYFTKTTDPPLADIGGRPWGAFCLRGTFVRAIHTASTRWGIWTFLRTSCVLLSFILSRQ